MSLLTNEQMHSLIDLHKKWCCATEVSDSYCDLLRKWNEKQAATQFEPDWSEAPEIAEIALIKLYWVGEGTYCFGQTIAQYDRPKPIITPHPHAEIMMKYAEVAARRVDPWVEFEWTSEEAAYVWRKHTCSPIFKDTNQYRHIGETK
jgi:hypothetical protein